jgi:tetratricopeptide (TPR) repeat protein
MSNMVYGFGALGAFEGTRYGFYRPRVFFATGLELGLWMNATTLVAWWLWRTGQLKAVWIFPGGLMCAALLITTVACRSAGATILLVAGASALWICQRTGAKWAMWVLLSVVPVYCFVRINNLWSGDSAVQLIRLFLGEERAFSLEFRLVNEDLLIAKALQQPIFGWGGWGRNFVYDEWKHTLSLIDGMWMVALGTFGLVGLIALTTTLLLPAVLFLKRFPIKLWDQPSLAPAAAIAVVVDLCLLDGLFNGMLNVIYIIAAGGLVNIVSHKAALAAQAAGSATSSAQSHAAHYRDLGRVLKEQRRYLEAKVAWTSALGLLTKEASAHPDVPALRLQWCECANDLAWLLVSAPDPAVKDPASAVSLAGQAVGAYPACSTYWNTLGAAYYRLDQCEEAIKALLRATSLTQGGTAFDHFFLAMAHTRLGNIQQAEQWTESAVRWMEQHHPDHPELIRLRAEAQTVGSAAAHRSLVLS